MKINTNENKIIIIGYSKENMKFIYLWIDII